MGIFDKLFSPKQEKETPKAELSVKSIEQEFINRIQHRILEYKRYEDSGIWIANCLFMDINEAKDINEHLNLLHKNQKDIGKFFNNMYHFTNCKDGLKCGIKVMVVIEMKFSANISMIYVL